MLSNSLQSTKMQTAKDVCEKINNLHLEESKLERFYKRYSHIRQQFMKIDGNVDSTTSQNLITSLIELIDEAPDSLRTDFEFVDHIRKKLYILHSCSNIFLKEKRTFPQSQFATLLARYTELESAILQKTPNVSALYLKKAGDRIITTLTTLLCRKRRTILLKDAIKIAAVECLVVLTFVGSQFRKRGTLIDSVVMRLLARLDVLQDRKPKGDEMFNGNIDSMLDKIKLNKIYRIAVEESKRELYEDDYDHEVFNCASPLSWDSSDEHVLVYDDYFDDCSSVTQGSLFSRPDSGAASFAIIQERNSKNKPSSEDVSSQSQDSSSLVFEIEDSDDEVQIVSMPNDEINLIGDDSDESSDEDVRSYEDDDDSCNLFIGSDRTLDLEGKEVRNEIVVDSTSDSDTNYFSANDNLDSPIESSASNINDLTDNSSAIISQPEENIAPSDTEVVPPQSEIASTSNDDQLEVSISDNLVQNNCTEEEASIRIDDDGIVSPESEADGNSSNLEVVEPPRRINSDEDIFNSLKQLVEKPLEEISVQKNPTDNSDVVREEEIRSEDAANSGVEDIFDSLMRREMENTDTTYPSESEVTDDDATVFNSLIEQDNEVSIGIIDLSNEDDLETEETFTEHVEYIQEEIVPLEFACVVEDTRGETDFHLNCAVISPDPEIAIEESHVSQPTEEPELVSPPLKKCCNQLRESEPVREPEEAPTTPSIEPIETDMQLQEKVEKDTFFEGLQLRSDPGQRNFKSKNHSCNGEEELISGCDINVGTTEEVVTGNESNKLVENGTCWNDFQSEVLKSDEPNLIKSDISIEQPLAVEMKIKNPKTNKSKKPKTKKGRIKTKTKDNGVPAAMNCSVEMNLQLLAETALTHEKIDKADVEEKKVKQKTVKKNVKEKKAKKKLSRKKGDNVESRITRSHAAKIQGMAPSDFNDGDNLGRIGVNQLYNSTKFKDLNDESTDNYSGEEYNLVIDVKQANEKVNLSIFDEDTVDDGIILKSLSIVDESVLISIPEEDICNSSNLHILNEVESTLTESDKTENALSFENLFPSNKNGLEIIVPSENLQIEQADTTEHLQGLQLVTEEEKEPTSNVIHEESSAFQAEEVHESISALDTSKPIKHFKNKAELKSYKSVVGATSGLKRRSRSMEVSPTIAKTARRSQSESTKLGACKINLNLLFDTDIHTRVPKIIKKRTATKRKFKMPNFSDGCKRARVKTSKSIKGIMDLKSPKKKSRKLEDSVFKVPTISRSKRLVQLGLKSDNGASPKKTKSKLQSKREMREKYRNTIAKQRKTRENEGAQTDQQDLQTQSLEMIENQDDFNSDAPLNLQMITNNEREIVERPQLCTPSTVCETLTNCSASDTVDAQNKLSDNVTEEDLPESDLHVREIENTIQHNDEEVESPPAVERKLEKNVEVTIETEMIENREELVSNLQEINSEKATEDHPQCDTEMEVLETKLLENQVEEIQVTQPNHTKTQEVRFPIEDELIFPEKVTDLEIKEVIEETATVIDMEIDASKEKVMVTNLDLWESELLIPYKRKRSKKSFASKSIDSIADKLISKYNQELLKNVVQEPTSDEVEMKCAEESNIKSSDIEPIAIKHATADECNIDLFMVSTTVIDNIVKEHPVCVVQEDVHALAVATTENVYESQEVAHNIEESKDEDVQERQESPQPIRSVPPSDIPENEKESASNSSVNEELLLIDPWNLKHGDGGQEFENVSGGSPIERSTTKSDQLEISNQTEQVSYDKVKLLESVNEKPSLPEPAVASTSNEANSDPVTLKQHSNIHDLVKSLSTAGSDSWENLNLNDEEHNYHSKGDPMVSGQSVLEHPTVHAVNIVQPADETENMCTGTEECISEQGIPVQGTEFISEFGQLLDDIDFEDQYAQIQLTTEQVMTLNKLMNASIPETEIKKEVDVSIDEGSDKLEDWSDSHTPSMICNYMSRSSDPASEFSDNPDSDLFNFFEPNVINTSCTYLPVSEREDAESNPEPTTVAACPSTEKVKVETVQSYSEHLKDTLKTDCDIRCLSNVDSPNICEQPKETDKKETSLYSSLIKDVATKEKVKKTSPKVTIKNDEVGFVRKKERILFKPKQRNLPTSTPNQSPAKITSPCSTAENISKKAETFKPQMSSSKLTDSPSVIEEAGVDYGNIKLRSSARSKKYADFKYLDEEEDEHVPKKNKVDKDEEFKLRNRPKAKAGKSKTDAKPSFEELLLSCTRQLPEKKLTPKRSAPDNDPIPKEKKLKVYERPPTPDQFDELLKEGNRNPLLNITYKKTTNAESEKSFVDLTRLSPETNHFSLSPKSSASFSLGGISNCKKSNDSSAQKKKIGIVTPIPRPPKLEETLPRREPAHSYSSTYSAENAMENNRRSSQSQHRERHSSSSRENRSRNYQNYSSHSADSRYRSPSPSNSRPSRSYRSRRSTNGQSSYHKNEQRRQHHSSMQQSSHSSGDKTRHAAFPDKYKSNQSNKDDKWYQALEDRFPDLKLKDSLF